MDCTTCQSLLVEYAYDELDPARRAVVEEELARCPDCRAELAAIRATRDAFAEPEEIELSALRRADVLRESRLAVDASSGRATTWWAALWSPATAMAAVLMVAAGASWWIVRGGAPSSEPLEQAAVATSEDEADTPPVDPHLIPSRDEGTPASDVPPIAEHLREQAEAMAEAPSQGALWDEAPSAAPEPADRSGYLEAEVATNAMRAPVEEAVPTGLGLGRSGGGAVSRSAADRADSGDARPIAGSAEGAGTAAAVDVLTEEAEDAMARQARAPAAPEPDEVAVTGSATGYAAGAMAQAEPARPARDSSGRAAPAPQREADDFGERRRAEDADEDEPGPVQQVARADNEVAVRTPATAEDADEPAMNPEFAAGEREEQAADVPESQAEDALAQGLAAYDEGRWRQAATLLRVARETAGVDVGTAVYYEAAALAALGDEASALELLARFEDDLRGHLLAGEARRLRETLQVRDRPDMNRQMDLEMEPMEAAPSPP